MKGMFTYRVFGLLLVYTTLNLPVFAQGYYTQRCNPKPYDIERHYSVTNANIIPVGIYYSGDLTMRLDPLNRGCDYLFWDHTQDFDRPFGSFEGGAEFL